MLARAKLFEEGKGIYTRSLTAIYIYIPDNKGSGPSLCRLSSPPPKKEKKKNSN